MNTYFKNPYPQIGTLPEKPLKRGVRWIWRSIEQGTYIRRIHGPIGIEAERLA